MCFINIFSLPNFFFLHKSVLLLTGSYTSPLVAFPCCIIVKDLYILVSFFSLFQHCSAYYHYWFTLVLISLCDWFMAVSVVVEQSLSCLLFQSHISDLTATGIFQLLHGNCEHLYTCGSYSSEVPLTEHAKLHVRHVHALDNMNFPRLKS